MMVSQGFFGVIPGVSTLSAMRDDSAFHLIWFPLVTLDQDQAGRAAELVVLGSIGEGKP
jgi:hypothetical protein